MNSSRSLIIFFLVLLIAAAFWGAIRYFNILEEEQRPSSSVAPRQEQAPVTVRITAQGFEPRALEVAKGQSVLFVNDDVLPHWPASDVHPVHTLCPGFDALRGLQKGEQYRVTFTKSQTCSFHDHLNLSFTGVMSIQ